MGLKKELELSTKRWEECQGIAVMTDYNPVDWQEVQGPELVKPWVLRDTGGTLVWRKVAVVYHNL